MNLGQLVQLLDKGGTLAALIFFIFGGYRGWWVWGWQFKQERKEKDEWKDLALRGSQLTQEAIDFVEQRKRALTKNRKG